MTEAEIIAALAAANTGLQNIILTGQRYEVGTGPSRRIFEAVNINDLRAYITSLKNELREVQETSGLVAGF